MATMLISLVIGIGGQLLQKLFAPKPKDVYGPRLSDVNVPTVSPGNPIVRHWGTMKLQGQLIWNSRLIETEHAIQADSGGKGGMVGGSSKNSPTQYTYTYSIDAAWMVCEGPCTQINRIWANQKLLWVNSSLAGRQISDFINGYYSELDRLVNQAGMIDYDYAYCGAFIFAYNNFQTSEYTYDTQEDALNFIMKHPGQNRPKTANIPYPDYNDCNAVLGQMLAGLGHDQQYAENRIRFDEIDVWLGGENQAASALINSYIGRETNPAYRGIAYFAIHGLQLSDFGNAIPTMQVEVQRTPGKVKLHELIHDVCIQSGLREDQIDYLSRMPKNVVLDGYAVIGTSTGRDILQNLMRVFPFDASESGFRLFFNWINTRPIARIRREDYGAHLDTDEMPPSEQITRIHDWDLPKQINLKYQEQVRAFSSNTVFAMRDVTQAQTIEDVDFTGALVRDFAQSWCDEMLALRFTGRISYKIMLPRKYAILEPGDAIVVEDFANPDNEYPLRLIGIDVGVNGICEATFVTHNFHKKAASITQGTIDLGKDSSGKPYVNNLPNILPEVPDLGQPNIPHETQPDLPPGKDVNPGQVAPPVSGPTAAYMLDIPLLTDDEADNLGFYAVLEGSGTGWRGATLAVDLGNAGTAKAFGSSTALASSGSSYYTCASTYTNGIHGYFMTALPDGHYGIFDNTTRCVIYCRNKGAQIISRSKLDVLTLGVNGLYVGGEIIQFLNAKDLGNDMWELSGFLRGLRGTETKMRGHIAGEAFCNLNRQIVQRVKHSSDYLNKVGTFKAITVGDTLDASTPFTFTDTGNSLRCRPVDFVGSQCYRDARDLHLRWRPRNRQKAGWFDGRETLVDQLNEAYEIDVTALAFLPDGSDFFISTKAVAGTRMRTLGYNLAAQGKSDLQARANQQNTSQLAYALSLYNATGNQPKQNDDAKVRFDVYQMGHDIGRGFVSSITL